MLICRLWSPAVPVAYGQRLQPRYEYVAVRTAIHNTSPNRADRTATVLYVRFGDILWMHRILRSYFRPTTTTTSDRIYDHDDDDVDDGWN